MGDGGGNHQQQARRRRQRRRQASRGDQRDHPVGKSCDLGIGQHHDVAIDVQFIGIAGRCVREKTLTADSSVVKKTGLGRVEGVSCPILHPTITILVDPGDQIGVLPLVEPVGNFRITLVLYRVDQVGASKDCHGGRSRVEDGDEEQRPACRLSSGADAGNGVEANDHMRKTGSSGHQCKGDGQQVDGIARSERVLGEAQLLMQPIEPCQQAQLFTIRNRPETDLRNRSTRHHQRDEDGRNHEGKNQNAVLSHLGVGDALHPAENCVDEDDGHSDYYSVGDIYLEKTAEHHPDSAHLSGDIGEGDEDGADHRDQSSRLGVIPLSDEIGHGELAELPQIRRQQQCQQHVAPGPSHQVNRTVVTAEGDDPRHRDERCGTHPIGSGGHSIGQRRDILTRDVELSGAGRPGTDGDDDVEEKGSSDQQVRPGGDTHHRPS